MQCPHCQAPVVPGATFCVQCGFPITQTPAGLDAATVSPMSVPQMPLMPMMPPDPTSFPVAPPTVPPLPVAYGVVAPPPPTLPATYGALPLSQPPAPSQPFYGTLPPSQPFYGILPPSQPLYPTAPPPPLYIAPATTPVSAQFPQPQGASVSQSLLGPNGVPGVAQPYSRIQALLMRNLSPNTVASPWLMAAIGAVAALVAGLILTALSGALWSNALDTLLGGSLSSGSSAST
ncbi:MAG: zinc ribbon domain-containing protein, partial [Ktedonobacterales bacterium]